MRLDIAKAKNNTARGRRLIVLRALRHFAIAAIEIVEESFMRVAVACEVRGLSAGLVELLGVLGHLDDLGVVVRLGRDVAAGGVGVALGFDAADHPQPWLAAGAEVGGPG